MGVPLALGQIGALEDLIRPDTIGGVANLIAVPLRRPPQRATRYELTDELRWGRYENT